MPAPGAHWMLDGSLPQPRLQDLLRGILTKKSFLKFLQDGTAMASQQLRKYGP